MSQSNVALTWWATLNRLFIAAALCLTLGACASAEVGDACETSGSTDECVDGAVCTQISSGDNVCRKSCAGDDDCAADEACNGISGTPMKSCQPKK